MITLIFYYHSLIIEFTFIGEEPIARGKIP
jgi:hypothetical protein